MSHHHATRKSCLNSHHEIWVVSKPQLERSKGHSSGRPVFRWPVDRRVGGATLPEKQTDHGLLGTNLRTKRTFFLLDLGQLNSRSGGFLPPRLALDQFRTPRVNTRQGFGGEQFTSELMWDRLTARHFFLAQPPFSSFSCSKGDRPPEARGLVLLLSPLPSASASS